MYGFWCQADIKGKCCTGAVSTLEDAVAMVEDTYRSAIFKLPDDACHDGEGNLFNDDARVQAFLHFCDQLS